MKWLGFIALALMVSSCVSKSKVYDWLDKNKQDAAKYCSTEFPARVTQGETKLIKVVDTLIKKETIIDTVDCPDGTKVTVEKDIRYVIQKEYLQRVDTTVDRAGEEMERLRANAAEADVAIRDGLLSVEKQISKARMWWIIGLGVLCAALFAFIIRKVF